jgi:hypothetical protein
MVRMAFDVPVALICFRRPAHTRRVIEAISAVQPRRLFVVADGPRPHHATDAEACRATRAVIDEVSWPCEVVKNYSDVNLGCGWRPATGISWVFEHVEEAIILEDDCVPDTSFFYFCRDLLHRYRHDARVMHIGGTTYSSVVAETPYSYRFSNLHACWGWATWRRAWRSFDQTLTLWPGLRKTSWLARTLSHERMERHLSEVFDRAHTAGGDVSYWDHQWDFACWANSGLAILPRHNLVGNIGCNEEGTHTLSANDPLANLPTREIGFPLRHPPAIVQDYDADQRLLDLFASRLPRPDTAMRRLRRVASRLAPGVVKRVYRATTGAMTNPLTSRPRIQRQPGR